MSLRHKLADFFQKIADDNSEPVTARKQAAVDAMVLVVCADGDITDEELAALDPEGGSSVISSLQLRDQDAIDLVNRAFDLNEQDQGYQKLLTRISEYHLDEAGQDEVYTFAYCVAAVAGPRLSEDARGSLEDIAGAIKLSASRASALQASVKARGAQVSSMLDALT